MPRDDNYQQERGQRWKVRILALLAEQPMTRSELAERMHLSPSGVHFYLKQLTAEPRQVRVDGYVRTGGRAFRRYALGSGPDAPFEGGRIKKAKVDFIEINCKLILDALDSPLTVEELAIKLRRSVSYVRKYIAILRAKPKRVYVKAWKPAPKRGSMAKVFARGNRADAPAPRLTSAERFQRLKADTEKYEQVLARRRLAAAVRRTRRKPNTWMGALITM